jgi:BirA family transcriptional regulator, biotin operon repressor / biotin---[acetyl-CoA-carboxylase] ligase
MNLLEVQLFTGSAQFLHFQTTLLLFFRPNFAMFKNTDLLPQSSSSAIIGEPFIILPQVESTNNYAMGLVHAGLASHGIAVFTEHQTAGKAQRGKTWESKEGENLAMSVIIKPPLHSNGFILSALIALCCREWYANYVKSEVFVKWPNDIYWRDRKAAGILIENSYRDNVWQWAVVGIGINVNQTEFLPSLKNPVSMKQITGNHYSPEILARELCQVINRRFQNLQVEPVLAEYNIHLYAKDQAVRLKKENAVFTSTIKGVDEKGELITLDVIERRFRFGEIEWLH